METSTTLTPELAERISGDVTRLRGLPGAVYGDDFYALEQRELFPKVWCVAGIASDLERAGDVKPVDLAGWPLLLVRDTDGDIRVFHNMCRHRSMRLANEPCNVGRSLVCPWHAWRYALDGRLMATPCVGGERQHQEPGIDPEKLGLVPVRTARWLDFVFVNIDGQAAPFEDHIAPLEQLFANHDLSDLQHADSWSIDYPGNWKVAVEGAIEDYHLPAAHPQLLRSSRRLNPRLDYADGVFYANSTAREYEDASSGNIATTLRSGLGTIPYSGNEPLRRSFFLNVFPTGMLLVHGDNVIQGMFLPCGGERTHLVFHHYYQGDSAADPAFAKQRDAIKAEWQRVFEQDIPFVEQVHQNYKRRDDVGIDTCLSQFWETNIQHFQRAVAQVVLQGKAN